MKLAFKAKSLILLLIFMLLVTMSLQFNALALAPPRNDIIVNQKLLENYQFQLNMFPLRAVMEQLGYDVQWNDIDQTVVFCKGTECYWIQINNTTYKINNVKNGELNYAPELIDGSTYLPIDFISNTQIGATNYRWDGLRIYSLDFIKTMPFIVGEISLIEKQEEQTFIGPDGITYTSIPDPVIKVNGKDANGTEKILTLKYLYNTTEIFSNQRTESIQLSQLNVGMKIKAFYDNDYEWALLIEEIK